MQIIINASFIIHGASLKILITGGAGFVCSHLADKLYEKGHSLILLDKKIEKKSVVKIDWKGFDIEDTWVYGYGMDDETGNNRQVPFISDE